MRDRLDICGVQVSGFEFRASCCVLSVSGVGLLDLLEQIAVVVGRHGADVDEDDEDRQRAEPLRLRDEERVVAKPAPQC